MTNKRDLHWLSRLVSCHCKTSTVRRKESDHSDSFFVSRGRSATKLIFVAKGRRRNQLLIATHMLRIVWAFNIRWRIRKFEELKTFANFHSQRWFFVCHRLLDTSGRSLWCFNVAAAPIFGLEINRRTLLCRTTPLGGR